MGGEVWGMRQRIGGGDLLIQERMGLMAWNLYVWEGVLCDYTCGMIVAVARSAEEAREIAEKENSLKSTVSRRTRGDIVYDMGSGYSSYLIGDWELGLPKAWVVWGGG